MLDLQYRDASRVRHQRGTDAPPPESARNFASAASGRLAWRPPQRSAQRLARGRSPSVVVVDSNSRAASDRAVQRRIERIPAVAIASRTIEISLGSAAKALFRPVPIKEIRAAVLELGPRPPRLTKGVLDRDGSPFPCFTCSLDPDETVDSTGRFLVLAGTLSADVTFRPPVRMNKANQSARIC